jgi:hypothetical protein
VLRSHPWGFGFPIRRRHVGPSKMRENLSSVSDTRGSGLKGIGDCRASLEL